MPRAAGCGWGIGPTRLGKPNRLGLVAGATAMPLATSSQDPTLIGEVTLKTRSMLKNRSGRPRSEISRAGLVEIPAKASAQARRASRRLPDSDARWAGAADAPPRPPLKKYQGISGFQTGSLT